MNRSLNATGRTRIFRESVVAHLDVRPDRSARLTVRLDREGTTDPLEHLEVGHADARVWATVAGLVYAHRISLGTVALLRPASVLLPDPELLPSNPTLRVSVVDPAGRILATTDDIPLGERSTSGTERMSLLPVEFADDGLMRGRVWKLSAGPEIGSDLRLLLHESVRDLDVNQRRDFAALVIPAAVQQVITDWYVHQELDEDEAAALVVAWRRKLEQLVGEDMPDGVEDAPEDERVRLWITFAEEAADAFAREIEAVHGLLGAWGGAP
jgi:hypothetical protein